MIMQSDVSPEFARATTDAQRVDINGNELAVEVLGAEDAPGHHHPPRRPRPRFARGAARELRPARRRVPGRRVRRARQRRERGPATVQPRAVGGRHGRRCASGSAPRRIVHGRRLLRRLHGDGVRDPLPGAGRARSCCGTPRPTTRNAHLAPRERAGVRPGDDRHGEVRPDRRRAGPRRRRPAGLLARDPAALRLRTTTREVDRAQGRGDAVPVRGAQLRVLGEPAELRPQAAAAAITAPTLVTVGRTDWITPVSCSETIAELIPDARLAVFEKSGHSPQIEEAEEWTSDGARLPARGVPADAEPAAVLSGRSRSSRQLDDLDTRIVVALQQDGRASWRAIADASTRRSPRCPAAASS